MTSQQHNQPQQMEEKMETTTFALTNPEAVDLTEFCKFHSFNSDHVFQTGKKRGFTMDVFGTKIIVPVKLRDYLNDRVFKPITNNNTHRTLTVEERLERKISAQERALIQKEGRVSELDEEIRNATDPDDRKSLSLEKATLEMEIEFKRSLIEALKGQLEDTEEEEDV